MALMQDLALPSPEMVVLLLSCYLFTFIARPVTLSIWWLHQKNILNNGKGDASVVVTFVYPFFRYKSSFISTPMLHVAFFVEL